MENLSENLQSSPHVPLELSQEINTFFKHFTLCELLEINSIIQLPSQQKSAENSIYDTFITSFVIIKKIITDPKKQRAQKIQKIQEAATPENPATALVAFLYLPSLELLAQCKRIEEVIDTQNERVKQYLLKFALIYLLERNLTQSEAFIRKYVIPPNQCHPLICEVTFKCLKNRKFGHAKNLKTRFKVQLDQTPINGLYYAWLTEGEILHAITLIKDFDVQPNNIPIEPSLIQKLYSDIEQSEHLLDLCYLINDLKILPDQCCAKRLLYLCLERSYFLGAELLKAKCRATLEIGQIDQLLSNKPELSLYADRLKHFASNISTTDEPQTPITFRTLR